MSSTAVFNIRSKNTNSFGYGSATCIAVGYHGDKKSYVFLTAKHNVRTDRTFFGITTFEFSESGKILLETKVVDGKDATFMILRSSSEVDIALVIVLTDVELDIEPVELLPESEAKDLKTGQRVFASVAPEIPYPAFRRGMIARFDKDGSMVLDIGVWEGDSGGGVFDERGRLIGICFAMYNQTLGLAVTIDQIYDFLRKNQIQINTMEKRHESGSRQSNAGIRWSSSQEVNTQVGPRADGRDLGGSGNEETSQEQRKQNCNSCHARN